MARLGCADRPKLPEYSERMAITLDRVILHSDCNSFYASVECLHRPEIRDKPVAVGGDAEQRHGIILAKNQIAKRYGIATGEALWQARRKCPELVIVPPNYPLYLRFSEMARKIYLQYSDRVEPEPFSIYRRGRSSAIG